MNLFNYYCAKCGGEVVIIYDPPPRVFRIVNGKLTFHDYSEDCTYGSIHFQCINDRTHEVNPDPDTRIFKIFDEWVDNIETEIDDRECRGEM